MHVSNSHAIGQSRLPRRPRFLRPCVLRLPRRGLAPEGGSKCPALHSDTFSLDMTARNARSCPCRGSTAFGRDPVHRAALFACRAFSVVSGSPPLDGAGSSLHPSGRVAVSGTPRIAENRGPNRILRCWGVSDAGDDQALLPPAQDPRPDHVRAFPIVPREQHMASVPMARRDRSATQCARRATSPGLDPERPEPADFNVAPAAGGGGRRMPESGAVAHSPRAMSGPGRHLSALTRTTEACG